MTQFKDPETGHTEDQSRALGGLMDLRGLLDELEERIDGNDADSASDTTEKIVLAAALLHGDAVRWATR